MLNKEIFSIIPKPIAMNTPSTQPGSGPRGSDGGRKGRDREGKPSK